MREWYGIKYTNTMSHGYQYLFHSNLVNINIFEVQTAHDELRKYPLMKSLQSDEVMNPDDVRDDLYICIDSRVISSAEAGEKNIELLVTLRDENGVVVDNAISCSSADKRTYIASPLLSPSHPSHSSPYSLF